MTLTTEDKALALAVRDYRRGDPVSAIAAEHELSQTAVIKAVKAAGIPLKQTPLSDREKALRTIERLYCDGLSQSMIARRLRLKPETIDRALRDIVRERQV